MDRKERRRRRINPKYAQTTAQEQRRAMNRRQHSSVQLRKKRKEEAMWKRRLQSRGVVSQQGPSIEGDVMILVKDFLQAGDKQRLIALEEALTNDPIAATSLLHKLLDDDNESARRLVSMVTNLLLREKDVERHAMSILLLLSSIAQASADDPASYYGTAPLRWSDILAEEAGLCEKLLSLLESSEGYVKEMASGILGNLVQDSSLALSKLRPSWPTIVSALPVSAFCCASIIRNDSTSFGMDFLKSLTTTHLRGLLKEDSTASHAVWMMEGLSRREDEALRELCTDARLLETFLQKTCHDIGLQESSDSTYFLVPALRTIANMATGCDGQYVASFLTHDALVAGLGHLLVQPYQAKSRIVSIMTDCIGVVACLMCDAGLPTHPATTIAVPAFLPKVVSILTSGPAPVSWKTDSAVSIQNAIFVPPGLVLGEDGPVMQTLDKMLQQLYEGFGESLVEALISLSRRPDADAVLTSLNILDNLLRSVAASRQAFESLSGVDRLEEICDEAAGEPDSSSLNTAASLAADLIDDLFDKEDDDGEGTWLQPKVQGDQFVFGVESAPATARPRGRGRGTTTPAWMQQS